MVCWEALTDEFFQIVSNAAEYRRYAKVARKLAEQKQSSDRFMWAQLAQLWDKAADRMVAKEKADGKVTPNGGQVHQP
jgi:hypothetical protein